MERWIGRLAIVTGASSGIGKTLAQELTKHGMKVAALATRYDKLQILQEKCNDCKGEMKIYQCDISNEHEIISTLECIVKDLGPVSVLVNSAAIMSPLLLTDISSGSCRKLYETNVIGLVTLTQNVIKIMKQFDILDGHIININGCLYNSNGDIAAFSSLEFGNYCATVQAGNALTTSLKYDLAVIKSKIRVTGISPEIMDTDFYGDYAKIDLSLSMYDIAKCVLFVLSIEPHINISHISVIPQELNVPVLIDASAKCNMERWAGRVAVITGASSGIGRALAKELARQGMKVAALARRLDRLQTLQEECTAFCGTLKPYKCDMTIENEIASTVELIVAELGPISVLVNNAAIFDFISLTDTNNGSCRQLYETNTIGLVTMTQHVFNQMKVHHIVDGHIINMNSVTANSPYQKVGLGNYRASKMMVASLTKTLLKEVQALKFKTKVTSINPGLVKTEMIRLMKHYDAILYPEDIVQCMIFALSTKYINISQLRVQPVQECLEAF